MKAKTKCPYCNYDSTEHEELNKKFTSPQEGDVSFCLNCAKLSLIKMKCHQISLIKVNIEDLPKTTQEEIKDIDLAWVKSKKLRDFEKERKGSDQ